MNRYPNLHERPEPDGVEQEWVDSLDGLVDARGRGERPPGAIARLERAEELGITGPVVGVTDYINTIPADEETHYPGDEALEQRIRHFIQWNPAVMVARANRRLDGIGDHLATLRVSRHAVPPVEDLRGDG